MALKLQPTVLVSDEDDLVTNTVGTIFSNSNGALKDLVEGNFSVEIFWFPFNSMIINPDLHTSSWCADGDKLWVKKINQEKGNKKPLAQGIIDLKQSGDWVMSKIFAFISPLVQKRPSITPIYLNTAYFFLSALRNPFDKVNPHYKMLPQAIHYQGGIEELLVYDMEFAFPVKDDFSNIIEAAKKVVDLVTERKGKFFVVYCLQEH